MKKFTFSQGTPLPFGASLRAGGINFSIFSRHAEEVSLLLFASGEGPKLAEIRLDPKINRTGDVWHVFIPDLDSSIRYGYRVSGPFDPKGTGHRFSSDDILLDPYATALTGGTQWGEPYVRSGGKTPESSFRRRCCIADNLFDWEGDRPLSIPLQDSIIYELHVRGFTQDQSSGVAHPGTYQGIVEKIPYLKNLGITAVELMPITEFDECENVNRNPLTGEVLKNFWGYSPLAFFAPKASYAVDGRNGNQVREFKEMVKALHRAGIEVILDMVFNHTAEGNESGPMISFRGLDNTIYYILDPLSREYLNLSGCGNTMNCNHPLVRSLIMDCLRYWVTEMHVDGFRFDLASILGRAPDGQLMSNPPVVEQIAEDPILADTKIIAEAWDASGLYQVGSFSSHPRWAEWNGRFRDDVRAFMTGRDNSVASLATRISGSADLYQGHGRRPFNSINFITCHDGFTLYDLVRYNHKHNDANGEDNRDGNNACISWNGGVEGETSNETINRLRWRRMRTMALILMVSQGAPMLLAGDEFGRTQMGNNNAYCQDNEISWFNWHLAEENKDLLRFFRKLIGLRRRHPVFRREIFFPGPAEGGHNEIEWQAMTLGKQDWSATCKTLAFFLNGEAVTGRRDDDFFIMFNNGRKIRAFEIPLPPVGRRWHLLADTSASSPADIVDENSAVIIKKKKVAVRSMAAVVLISKEIDNG